MTALLWLLLLFLAFMTALASSTRLRKNAFIWFSYATITMWYYFRVLYKKYSHDGKKDETTFSRSTKSSSSSSSSKIRAPFSANAVEDESDPDLVFFESRDVVERRQRERSGSSNLSDSASSGGFDGTAATHSKKKKGGLFHSRRKAAAEEALRRVSDTSSADLLINSGASEANVSRRNTTGPRRTYTGRKKPVSWAE